MKTMMMKILIMICSKSTFHPAYESFLLASPYFIKFYRDLLDGDMTPLKDIPQQQQPK